MAKVPIGVVLDEACTSENFTVVSSDENSETPPRTLFMGLRSMSQKHSENLLSSNERRYVALQGELPHATTDAAFAEPCAETQKV